MKEKLSNPDFRSWMVERGFHFEIDFTGTHFWKKVNNTTNTYDLLSGKELFKLYDQWFAENQRRIQKELQIAKIVTWVGIGLMVIGVLLFIYSLIIKE